MNEIVKLISSQSVSSDVLSHNALLADYVDWNSRQSFDEFCNETNIKFSSNDFCIMVEKNILDRLKNDGKIYLTEIKRFGWFDKNVHYTKWRTFIEHSPEIYSRISDINQSSFSQFRKNIRSLDELDRLKGALLLSWRHDPEAYEKFFSKIEIKNKNKWIINLQDLSNDDLQIFSQLTLICSEDKSKFEQPLFEYIGKKITIEQKEKEQSVQESFILGQKVLNLIKNYMLDVPRLEKEEFINFLISKKSLFNNENFSNDLQLLHKQFVQQLRVNKYTHPITKRLSRVISVIDSDIGEIKSDLKKFSKFELFIIGLIKGQGKIESSGFNVNNVVYFSLEVICDALIDIQPRSSGDKEVIHMNFDSKSVERDVGNKFDFVQDSITLFKYKLGLYNHRNKITSELVEIEDDLARTARAITARTNELDALDQKLSTLIDENLKKNKELKEYQNNKKLSTFNTIIDNYIKGQDQAELAKNINSLKDGWNDFIYAFKNDSRLNGEKGTHLDSFEENKDGSAKKSSKNKKMIINTIHSVYQKNLFSSSNKQQLKDISDSKISQSVEFEHIEGVGIKKVLLSDKKQIEELENDKMWKRNS